MGGSKFFLENQAEDNYKRFAAKSRSLSSGINSIGSPDDLDDPNLPNSEKGLSRAERRLKQRISKDGKKT